MKAALFVRLFQINPDPLIREHFGMHDFSVVVQRKKRIHHGKSTSLFSIIIACGPSDYQGKEYW